MNPREQRGLQLADTARISRHEKSGAWSVPSQSGGGRYSVEMDGESPSCDCPDHAARSTLTGEHLAAYVGT